MAAPCAAKGIIACAASPIRTVLRPSCHAPAEVSNSGQNVSFRRWSNSETIAAFQPEKRFLSSARCSAVGSLCQACGALLPAVIATMLKLAVSLKG